MGDKSKDSVKIDEFKGKLSEKFNVWLARIKILLKGKGYWTKLQDSKTCPEKIKDKATSTIFGALGDALFQICL